jgi:ribose 1,5-bisphosphokinase PhnN
VPVQFHHTIEDGQLGLPNSARHALKQIRKNHLNVLNLMVVGKL